MTRKSRKSRLLGFLLVDYLVQYSIKHLWNFALNGEVVMLQRNVIDHNDHVVDEILINRSVLKPVEQLSDNYSMQPTMEKLFHSNVYRNKSIAIRI